LWLIFDPSQRLSGKPYSAKVSVVLVAAVVVVLVAKALSTCPASDEADAYPHLLSQASQAAS
jgi:hypothetical protein